MDIFLVIVDFLFGGAVGAVLLGSAAFFFRESIVRWLDKNLSKQMEDHKKELAEQLQKHQGELDRNKEFLRHQLEQDLFLAQTKMRRIMEIYPVLFEKFAVALGMTTQLFMPLSGEDDPKELGKEAGEAIQDAHNFRAIKRLYISDSVNHILFELYKNLCTLCRNARSESTSGPKIDESYELIEQSGALLEEARQSMINETSPAIDVKANE